MLELLLLLPGDIIQLQLPPVHNRGPACSYLYKSNSPGVLDYLCNRLYTLPERDVERYLSQLTQLAIQRGPNSSLGRVIVGLCAQSLRIAVKVGCCVRPLPGWAILLQSGSCFPVLRFAAVCVLARNPAVEL